MVRFRLRPHPMLAASTMTLVLSSPGASSPGPHAPAPGGVSEDRSSLSRRAPEASRTDGAILSARIPAGGGAKGAAARPDSDKPWKIEEPHGPSQTVSFTTDEGTWISLDVHPDGTKIVFSLLGDLYLLPIAGGEARRITDGPAYDVQPRFSPDGKWIAFASDRGGTENLWICDLEGKNARPVSADKDSIVNGPTWSTDGDWIVGRKRLTDASSIGSVELWMWHVKGGQGLQLTKKDDQPDAADPAFSRDGRFIFFSARDARYRYDNNVNAGIWQIKRFDRKTGQTVPVTGEFGGAAAPAISPDGRSMAYVRRVRAKERLVIMDLESGRVRTLAEGVQRDQQEGFGFHGVFPGYAWTPDGRAIVATADGKIQRFDTASGARTEIPFAARVDQRVTDAVRFPHPLGEATFRARILRWPVESPDGKRLVFVAVGHLYVMDLPNGTPRRLTSGGDLEYAPAFSPDGASLAFVTWNDREGGHLWSAPIGPEGAGTPKRLSAVPGQYANPAYSPDGKKIVFVRGSGAYFRDEDLADELWHEIRWIDAGGGESHLVIGTKNRGPNRRMPRPRFSKDGERIFYVEDEPPAKPADSPKSLLVSVKLDGTDRRAHIRWASGQEAVVSPDEKWVVLNALHNAYITALPVAGSQTIDLALEEAALPLGQLTDEGGDWVDWADGGRTITWIFGPVYHRLALDKAFPPPETEESKAAREKAEGEKRGKPRPRDASGSRSDAPRSRTAGASKSGAPDATPNVGSASSPPGASPSERAASAAPEAREKEEESGSKTPEGVKKKELPRSEAIEIVTTLPRARPKGVVAYTGARLVTMKGDEVIERGTILVEDDRIRAVGPESSVAIPPEARRVDVAGRTIIPGLIDEHAHLHYQALDIFPERPWRYLANLAYGITTTHDPSASSQEVFGQSEMVEAGLMTGPRIFSTGFILYGADLPGRAVVKSLDDARHHVRRMKALGAFTVKSYMQPRREQRQWILEAAREEGVMVVPEGGGDLEMDMTMILDGHTTVEHAQPIAPLEKDVVTLFSRSRTSYTPTLLVAYGGLSGDKWFYQHEEVWKDEKLLRYTPQGVIDRAARIRDVMATDEDWHHIDVAASAKKVLEAGGRVCLGGHGQLQGLGPHWELRAFVQGGMTPHEALRVATILPAETLGLDRDLGSIEPGKLADFVVLEKNPLEAIENSSTVALVVKNGFVWTPKELERAKPAFGW